MNDQNQPAGLPLPPAYRLRDRELPQRLLGILLWVLLLLVLWTFGAR